MKYGLVIIILILSKFTIVAQGPTKIYYDKDWKICSNINNAAFYREVNLDSKGIPAGIIKDYYITGEIQWQGYEKQLDLKTGKGDGKFGVCTWFYKNGKKSSEAYYVNGEEDSIINHWYENGQKKSEAFLKNKKYNGLYREWYENGKIKYEANYKDDDLVNSTFKSCVEEGSKCLIYFEENFKNNLNNWPIIKEPSLNAKFIDKNKKKYLEIKKSNEETASLMIDYLLPNDRDIAIQTDISYTPKKGSVIGLLFDFKSWSDYKSLLVNDKGEIKIENVQNGVNKDEYGWENIKVKYPVLYNQIVGQGLIRLQIYTATEGIFAAVNNVAIGKIEIDEFNGNKIGYYFSGKQNSKIGSLIIEKADEDPLTSKNKSTKKYKGYKGNGSGVFISNDGYIATNFHVVDGARVLEVELNKNNESKTYKAKLVNTDQQNDLAIIKIEDSTFVNLSTLPYSIKTELSDVGTNCFALGYPMALDVMGQEVKFTDGKISSKTGVQGDVTTYQISVPVQPGNSGGPLFDYDGNLVGIINSKLINGDNVSYAIKSNFLKNLIESLPTKTNVPNQNLIINKSLTEKVKELSDYVPLIKIK